MSKLSSKTSRTGSSRKPASRAVSRSMAKVSGAKSIVEGPTEGELIAEVKRSEASLSKKDMPPMQGIGLAPKLMLYITLVTAIVTF